MNNEKIKIFSSLVKSSLCSNFINNEKLNKLESLTRNKVLDLYYFLNKKEFFGLAKRMNINNIKIQKEGDLLKFRGWDSKCRLPQKIVVKPKVIKYSESRKDQKIIKRVLYAKIEKFEEFKRRWINKNKPPKSWANARSIPYHEKEGWLWIKLHDNWIFNEITPRPKDFSYIDKWLYYRVPKNYVALSYTSGEGHTHFILVPSLITKDEFFFEGLGLQQGDGTQSLSDVHITFTNGCEDLIHHQVEWFKRLGISKEALRVYPEIPSSLDHEKELFKWKNDLKISGIEERQFREPKTNNQNLRNSLVQILFHNKLFKLAYIYILHDLRKEIVKSKDNCISYMKGILASEGAIRLDNSKIPGSIKISASSEERRKFYKECLNVIGIEASKDGLTPGSEAVVITHFNNFRKIFKMNLLQLHRQKQKKFLKALMKYQKKKEGLFQFERCEE